MGSRNATRGGEHTSTWLAAELSRQGLTIVSGLATGIDSAAHRGALQVNGSTIAVMGTGINRVYPGGNKTLAREIQSSGCLVSEYPLSTPPRAINFPQRNRIISGLSLGTVVVEAATRSGSLITARCAMEQNREVFAVPDSIHNPLATGNHKLIQQGAKLVDSVHAILEELHDFVPSTEATGGSGNVATASSNSSFAVSDDEALLLNALGLDLCTADDLSLRTGMSVVRVNQLLAGLEIKDVVDVQMGRFRQAQHHLQQNHD